MMIKRACVLGILFLNAVTLSAAAIEGAYTFTGWDPYEKSNYSGTATITKDDNDVYQGIWFFSDSEEYKGTGLVSDNEISFVFVSAEENQNIVGIQLYKIDGTTLSGTWTLFNKSLVGNETMKKK